MKETDKQQTPYSLGRTARRLVAGAAAGIALFAFGALVLQTGALGRLDAAFGGAVASRADGGGAAARQAMLDARAAMKKDPKAPAPPVPVGRDGYFVPPSEAEMPKGPLGDTIRRGRDIFVDTGKYAPQYVGNSMACAQCHLDAGRRENAAPMWAAYVQYPMYRAKNGKVNSMEERLAGCFSYSMNAQASPAGKAPPPGDEIYKSLQTYMFWLASGAPTGEEMRGTGYIKVKKPAAGYDFARGAKVYAQSCALCHGANGEGRNDESGKLRFPPLWGAESYNWGAGMHSISTAAGFIKANMPFGKPYSLTDQQAWDAAAFINGHERPKDPRQSGTIEETAARHHKGDNYYGKVVDGHLLGAGVERAQPAAH